MFRVIGLLLVALGVALACTPCLSRLVFYGSPMKMTFRFNTVIMLSL